MRIAHVAMQLDTGGMERLLAEFARHADRQRVELTFLALGRRGPVAADIEACGWRVRVMDAPVGVRPLLVYQLARLLDELKIDLVHTHNTKPVLYAGPAAKLASVRGVVHTRHGQRLGATRRQDWLFRLAARCVDCIVCVSQDTAQLCNAQGIDAASIRTIWNGVDLRRFTVAGRARAGPAVFVGRLSPEKDLATLMRAMSIAAARSPSLRMELAGAGPGEAELRGMIASLGLSERVRLLGEVRDVSGLMHRAGLFVLASRTEGLPLTVLEAMASGLPVVATSVGGVPEAVAEGRTGLLAAPGDFKALAAAMVRIHEDQDLAQRLGSAGRARAEAHFDVRGMVSRYESLYSEVLGEKGMQAA